MSRRDVADAAVVAPRLSNNCVPITEPANPAGSSVAPEDDCMTATIEQAPPATLDTLADLLRRILHRLTADSAELLGATQAASLAGVSRPTWYRLVAAKKAPAAVRLAGSVKRWRKAELLHWIKALRPQ
jgi:predicted DNA-binding transcriptional regulator AlpA